MFGWKLKKQHSSLNWLLPVAIIFIITALSAVLGIFIFEYKYQNKIYPRISIGKNELGGLSQDQAVKILNDRIDDLNQKGIIFRHQEKEAVLMPQVSSVEGDFAYQLININTEKTIDRIFSIGRRHNSFFYNLSEQIYTLAFGKNIPLNFGLNEKEITGILADNFAAYNVPSRDAKLVYEVSYSAPYHIFSVTEEAAGEILEFDKAINKLKNNLSRLDTSSILLSSKIAYPGIYKKDCLNIQAKAENLLDKSPLTLYYNQNKWQIEKAGLAKWLALQANSSDKNDDKIIVGLDREKIKNYLTENVSPKINQKAKDAKFEIKDGRVAEFQASQDGIELNLDASMQKIAYELLVNNNNNIELAVSSVKSAISTESINDMGIKEIIGTGESNFSGSPSNRRHNIAVGANALNGTIIKPDEEFSLIAALGDIDKEAGYLPELVIKDNKTIPEYGGGLCQIGTTIFRTALGTGLPITMRRNHSYRVSYYEPAGTDATIYDPWPDFKFINDTVNSILIQSRIEGDNLYFDFWGTADGRTATRTYPVITNIVRPGPTKIIETTELEPGVKKCTEHAHNGADAYFDYTVKYSKNNPPAELEAKEEITEEDLTVEKRFYSHYAPWREVCLLGVEELSENKSATSSEEKVEEKN